MKSPFTWTVGRKLTALAGIGLVTAATVGVVAVRGMSNVSAGEDSLVAYEQAVALSHAIDTRASELKVDGYKALTLKDTSTLLSDLADDIATPQDLIAH